MEYIKSIRNFAIIAHIDHGKSTLSDRLIEKCQGLSSREMFDQVLDSMDIERERGITIKAQTVRLLYHSTFHNLDYTLNFIDTPGHVDFGYEVSRSLRACESSILVVDATQGVEAQTLANVYKAIECNHEFIIALNKIDLPTADPEKVKEEITQVIGMSTDNVVEISAKTGFGVDELLERIVHTLPSPIASSYSELKALLVDSWYDQYLGVVILVRMIDGKISKGMEIKMLSNGTKYVVDSVGVFTPKKVQVLELKAGEVGFISCAIKNIRDCNVGDTIVNARSTAVIEQISGFKKVQPVVFCSLYTIEMADFPLLQDAIQKLHLNDQSFEYEIEKSNAFGFGLRCGFLGMLHIEVIQERLEREFNLHVITTAPSVTYRIHLKSGSTLDVQNPNDMPDTMHISHIEEPYVRATIIVPDQYVGSVLSLCNDRRGQQINMLYSNGRVILTYRLPLNEIVYDFYDILKSSSSGYASFDWEHDDYANGDLVKLNIFVNGEVVEGFSCIVHRSKAEGIGRNICIKLRDLIPRHMFQIAIQAAIGARVIAREDVKAMRKNVTAKCYGGDITRKRKLLEKQKEGKKKMKAIGKVSIPQNAFIATLKRS